MIICVSANPAIDRRLRIDQLRIGKVNRAVSVKAFAGGKAAHVAMAARALGERAVWVGFLGGSTGEILERQLKGLGVEVVAVCTTEPTRSNDEIIDDAGNVTEILEPGGLITGSELESFYQACGEQFAEAGRGFQSVFSGSLPPGVPDTLYSDLTDAARSAGGNVILDASGPALSKGLSAGPDLIKPNIDEAGNLAGFAINDEASAMAAAERFIAAGAVNVAISMGASGIFWSGSNHERFSIAVPPSVEPVSTVGSGDAAVAGFAVAAVRGLDEVGSLRLAVACGTANCLASLPGQIDRKTVERILPLVAFREIDR